MTERAEPVVRDWRREVTPTDVYDEWFESEMGEVWLVKSDRTPTRNVARKIVAEHSGEPYIGFGCRTQRARIEWRDYDGWWLTLDPEGAYEVWEVYSR